MMDRRPLACLLPEADQRARREQTLSILFQAAQQAQELPDGYGFAFSSQPERLNQLAQFVAFERDCCPFFLFELVCEPDHGPIWLRIRGPEGVKEMLQTELEAAGNLQLFSERAST